MIRKYWIAAALAFAGLVAAGVTLAMAPPDGQEFVVTYYSNATYKVAVGGTRTGCGFDQEWGVRSGYPKLVKHSCGY